MAGYFPLFFNIEGREVLVAGGGKVALRRVSRLLEFGACIRLVAPEVPREIEELAQNGKIEWSRREFCPEDVRGTEFFVLAATDEEELNCRICRISRMHGVWANNASDHTQCDFYFPAVVREGELVAGIAGDGKDHRRVADFAAGMRRWIASERKQTDED